MKNITNLIQELLLISSIDATVTKTTDTVHWGGIGRIFKISCHYSIFLKIVVMNEGDGSDDAITEPGVHNLFWLDDVSQSLDCGRPYQVSPAGDM